jgi:hypothetical protein
MAPLQRPNRNLYAGMGEGVKWRIYWGFAALRIGASPREALDRDSSVDGKQK